MEKGNLDKLKTNILLRSVWARNLMYDIILGQIRIENGRCVFPTTIRPEGLYFDRKLIINQVFEMNKLIKDLRFTLKQINPSKSSEVINEKNIIL